MKPDIKFSTPASKLRKSAVAVETPARALASEPREADEIEIGDLDEDFVLAPAAAPSADVRPNPVELPAPINPEGGRKQSVEMHRNLFCVHYDNCLDEAVKRGWNSFSCVRCHHYTVPKEEEKGGVERFATQRRA
jgi:hypothetical protein